MFQPSNPCNCELIYSSRTAADSPPPFKCTLRRHLSVAPIFPRTPLFEMVCMPHTLPRLCATNLFTLLSPDAPTFIDDGVFLFLQKTAYVLLMRISFFFFPCFLMSLFLFFPRPLFGKPIFQKPSFCRSVPFRNFLRSQIQRVPRIPLQNTLFFQHLSPFL